MKILRKLAEKFLYSFGINLSGYDVDYELGVLKKEVPTSFLKREITDIGCGDGRVTLKLKKILEPERLLACDLAPSLVKAAQNRGIEAKIVDIEKEGLSGDLGILWGVVHHLRNSVDSLKKLNKNFKSLMIRESMDEKRIFEVGHKFSKKELLSVLKRANIDPKRCKLLEIPKTKALVIFINI